MKAGAVRDRLLLVTAAFVVAALLGAYFVVTDRLGLGDDAQALFAQTLGLAVFASLTRRTSPWRRRKLRLRWPLVVTSIGLVLAHVGTVGTFVILCHPGWRAPHWELMTVFELVIFSVVLSWVDEYCTMDRRPTFSAFLGRQLRIATGHTGSDESARD
jgi:drug/metabolite transporter (DMT)-like permease